MHRTHLCSKHYSFIWSLIIRSYWRQQRGACYIHRCRGVYQPDLGSWVGRNMLVMVTWKTAMGHEVRCGSLLPKDPPEPLVCPCSHPPLHHCQHDLTQIPFSSCHSPTQKMTGLPLLEEWVPLLTSNALPPLSLIPLPSPVHHFN